MVRPDRRPQRAHGGGQRLAARPRRQNAIAFDRARKRGRVGNWQRDIVGDAAAREQQQAEQDRNTERNDRESHRIEKFGPTGTAVRVH